jgi:AraC-like DNA-binding protein
MKPAAGTGKDIRNGHTRTGRNRVMKTVHQPAVHASDAAKSYRWRISNDFGQGAIRREKLGNGLFMTHSAFQSERPLVSRFDTGEPTATFVFMVRGQVRVKPDTNRPWTDMREGNWHAFASENTRIVRETPAGQHMEALVIKISVNRLRKICDDLGVTLPAALARPATPVAQPCSMGTKHGLAKLLENSCGSATARLLAQAHAIELVGELLFARGSCLRRGEIDTIRELGAYLAAHLDQTHSLAELAAMTAMNHAKLNRLFKAVHDCTVFDFIRRERLREAERCLCHTDMSITEIAHAAGFCSSSHFCNFFRRVHGQSPRMFRAGVRPISAPPDPPDGPSPVPGAKHR